MTMLRTLMLYLACFCPCIASAQALQPLLGAMKFPDSLSPETLNSVEAVIVGKLTRAAIVTINKSFPPQYHCSLSISVEEVLSGDVKVGTQRQLSHCATQIGDPVYPVGRVCTDQMVNIGSPFDVTKVVWLPLKVDMPG